ncbi:MAG: phosphoesterase [Planctomycetes bacterium]|nr:phosphoesterase [Planctomycetota bacterium]
MNDKSGEQVLVMPTRILHDAGVFQGLMTRVEQYLPRLLDPAHLHYLPRAQAEADPSFKQIIPYAVLKWRDQLFNYVRGKRASETRLQALRSIGVGGHINPGDASLFDSPYREAMLRELAEEVRLETTYEEHCLGLINDDSTPVGQVHLGIVHLFELAEPRVERREQGLTKAGFTPLAELRQARGAFETWSQFVLDSM